MCNKIKNNDIVFALSEKYKIHNCVSYKIKNMKLDHQILLHKKIEAGNFPISGAKIVHTAPHHDDIVLSYHPYLMRNLIDNEHHILYATSGCNGVSDEYILRLIRRIDKNIVRNGMQLSYQELLELFSQAYCDKNDDQMLLCAIYSIVQFVAEIFACDTNDMIAERLNWLILYFSSKKQGSKDIELVVTLKGRIRESEADRKWMISKGDIKNVEHFRAAFYKADEKTFDDAMELDIQRLVAYLDVIAPDIITVALDPCGIGPKNHFTTLQLVAAAMQRLSHKNIQIIGYRNIWSNFEANQASMIVPVTQHEIDSMKSIFLNCFLTQKNTLFVGTEIDGTFADQTEQIQKIQWQQVQKMLEGVDQQNYQLVLGDELVGAIFLKVLTIDELVAIVDCR